MNHLFQSPAILIIDDESDIRFLLSNILKQRNFGRFSHPASSEADNIIKEEAPFSYIFLDNHLPDGLGVDHIKQIKERCPLSKVIMITAHDNLADREKASHEGADHFIGKPFSRESILKTIGNTSY
ncbi:MAG: response regulator [Bacteroidota bacterium]